MIWEIVTGIVQLFIVEPFQKELDAHLRQVGAPAAVVQQVAGCAAAATPVLAERVAGDPLWGAATVIRLWLGTTSYEAVLGDQVAACGPALAAARPFLAEGGE